MRWPFYLLSLLEVMSCLTTALLLAEQNQLSLLRMFIADSISSLDSVVEIHLKRSDCLRTLHLSAGQCPETYQDSNWTVEFFCARKLNVLECNVHSPNLNPNEVDFTFRAKSSLNPETLEQTGLCNWGVGVGGWGAVYIVSMFDGVLATQQQEILFISDWLRNSAIILLQPML